MNKDNIKKFTTILLFLLRSCFEVQGQTKTTLITGVVKTESGDFVPHSTIFSPKLNKKIAFLLLDNLTQKANFKLHYLYQTIV